MSQSFALKLTVNCFVGASRAMKFLHRQLSPKVDKCYRPIFGHLESVKVNTTAVKSIREVKKELFSINISFSLWFYSSFIRVL